MKYKFVPEDKKLTSQLIDKSFSLNDDVMKNENISVNVQRISDTIFRSCSKEAANQGIFVRVTVEQLDSYTIYS